MTGLGKAHDGNGGARDVASVVDGLKIGPGPLNPRLRGEFTYSVVAAEPKPAQKLDKRGTARLRTRLRSGHLADRRNKIIVECLIQDRSRTGARLRLTHDRPLPKTFLLSDHLSETQFLAQLAWQRGRDAGVRLVSI